MTALKKDWYKPIAEQAKVLDEDLRKIKALGPSYVYFIEAVGTEFIKIGRSCSPARRMADLQTAFPMELKLIGTMLQSNEITERGLHERFASSRVRGEWFKATGELYDFLKTTGALT